MNSDDWIRMHREAIVLALPAIKEASAAKGSRWSVAQMESGIAALAKTKHGDMKGHSAEFRARWQFAVEAEIEREFNKPELTPELRRRAWLRARWVVADRNLKAIEKGGHPLSASTRLSMLDDETSKEFVRLSSDEQRAQASARRPHPQEALFA